MTLDTNTLLIAILALLVIIVLWIIRIEWRMSRLLKGKGSTSIEDSLVSLRKDIISLETFKKETLNYLTDAERRIKRSVQAVETIRFNPFKGTGAGGNQSFASAFLNQNGDGIVISSLYSRDRVSVYAKGVKEFNSEFELSDEEKEVLKTATQKTR